MKLNWKYFSNTQDELDLIINREKMLNHNDYPKEKVIALLVELGELLNEKPETFKYWKNKRGHQAKALVEYVDGIHFLLSYGNTIKFDFSNYEYKRPKELDQRDLILGLFNIFSMLHKTKDIETALNHFLFLGEKFNFTSEQIKFAYLDKVEVNRERAENGY